MTLVKTQTVLEARGLSKTFVNPDGKIHMVLENINFSLLEGEIVALLGRSGCGKSTLLRTLIGLIPPSAGEVRYRGRVLEGPAPSMAMIFQSFALFPWLTIQGNVELGLEAQRVPSAERRTRALEMIDLIGLDGFESAFPKELSGGMRQRVGFARALVTNPEVLFMDEPFSALDVLTAENLRGDLLELWTEKRISTQCILMVTHNIEEAVGLADRIVVLAPNPGRVRAEVTIPLKHPRDRDDPAFRELVEKVYTIMTTPPPSAEQVRPAEDRSSIAYRLPAAPMGRLLGLLERVAQEDYGKDDLPRISAEMHLEVDDLFPLTDAAELLGFARVSYGDITLLAAGTALVEADTLRRKQIFAEHLLARVPLEQHIVSVLKTRPERRAPEERFLRELEDFMPPEDAQKVLSTAIDWGRYAEVFEYDFNSGIFSLEDRKSDASV